PIPMIGHVTSSYWSAALDRSIALALVENGHERMGETIHIPMPGGVQKAVIANPVFYDPEGKRLAL
ncbi:MAG: glycine cleavage T C-terminal barrel domain-containing protein, partial [Pseudomonadota bacterium]